MKDRCCSLYNTAVLGWGNISWGSAPWGGGVEIPVLNTPPTVRITPLWIETGIQRPTPLAATDSNFWKEGSGIQRPALLAATSSNFWGDTTSVQRPTSLASTDSNFWSEKKTTAVSVSSGANDMWKER